MTQRFDATSLKYDRQRPVIALDIDDVLVDSVTAILGHYNQTYGTALTKTHYYGRDLAALGVNDYALAAKRLEAYLKSEAYTELAPLTDAVRAVENLSQYYEFIAVTSRPSFIQERTVNWLRRHFGEAISDVVFTYFIVAAATYKPEEVLSKVEVCKAINASYMIEDHLHHAVPVAEEDIRVFLFNQPWNQADTLPRNMQRVNTWQEIETHLQESISDGS